MNITKINSAENWYQAQESIPSQEGMAICTGYGTTQENAIADCMRAIESTKKLQKSMGLSVKNPTLKKSGKTK